MKNPKRKPTPLAYVKNHRFQGLTNPVFGSTFMLSIFPIDNANKPTKAITATNNNTTTWICIRAY